MSKNSKNARRIRTKRDWRGNKPGPAKTKKVHTKVNTWHARLAGKVNAPAPKKKTEEASGEE
jgi:hypothetical protein